MLVVRDMLEVIRVAFEAVVENGVGLMMWNLRCRRRRAGTEAEGSVNCILKVKLRCKYVVLVVGAIKK